MAEPSYTHQWIPRIEQREKNLFIEEYYSSTDTQIKMKGEEQFEIGYIQYSLQEQLKPLYGYSSRTFDDVAIGNRVVTGTFTVPIKNPEGQTPLEVLEEYSEKRKRPEDNDDDTYNDDQESMKEAIDWISGGSGGYKPPAENKKPDKDKKEDKDEPEKEPEEDTPTQDTTSNSSKPIDKDTQNYIDKFIKLGYTLASLAIPSLAVIGAAKVLKEQIRKFQKDHGMEENGDLNDEVKEKVDEELENKFKDKLTVPPGVALYEGPGTTQDIITTLKTETVVNVLMKFGNDWYEVMMPDGITTGYIHYIPTAA